MTRVSDEPKSSVVTIGRGSPEETRARFDAQVLPHLDAAYRFARWLARSPADADDVVQEAMLRAFRGFDGLRGGDVKAWLFAIVRNCHLTALAQRERRGCVPLPAEGDPDYGTAMVSAAPGPECASMRRDEARSLERLLGDLPPEHREVLILREIEELDYRDIAAVTQAPIGTVMSRLARARANLRARWLSKSEEERDAVR
jgi:RNA polymerase sigma factor (sigma-70 family)